MKKSVMLVAIMLASLSIKAQSLQINRAGYEGVLNQGVVLDLSPIQKDLEKQRQFYTDEQWKALMQKKYLTVGYSPCYVDDYKELGYLKYNMADDQMEFLKDNQTLYLKKERGRTIKFTTLKSTYKVYELDGRLDYFLVQKAGKNPLLVKQIVKFIKPRPAQTSYDEYKPANFLRVKDQYFIAMGDKNLVKIPKKKKRFFEIFGDKSSQIKDFMKDNQLGYRSLSDLEQIVNHFNTL